MIYVIRAGNTNHYKIGYTERPIEERLKENQTGSPDKLSVVFACDGDELKEQAIHADLIQFRTNGGTEWFCLNESQIENLKERLGEYGYNPNPVSFIGGTSFDVRPLCGRQQYPIANIGKDVSGQSTAFDNASRQHLFDVSIGEHQECLPTVFR